MFVNNIDFNNVPDDAFDLIPEGTYQAIAESIEIIQWVEGRKEIKTSLKFEETEEDKLEIKFQVVNGQQQGRIHFCILQMWNKEEFPRKMARVIFKQLCTACGKDANNVNRNELYNIPVDIKIKHSKCGKYANVSSIKKSSGASLPLNNKDVPF